MAEPPHPSLAGVRQRIHRTLDGGLGKLATALPTLVRCPTHDSNMPGQRPALVTIPLYEFPRTSVNLLSAACGGPPCLGSRQEGVPA